MLIITLFTIWLIVVIYELNYYLYFWQTKDFRVDRFLIDFKASKGAILLTKWTKIKIIFLAILALFLVFLQSGVQLPTVLNSVIASGAKQFNIYIILALYTVNLFYLIIIAKFKKPIFTKKTVLILILAFFIIFLSGVYSLLITNYSLLLILDIIVLPILSFWILFFIPFVYFFKQYLVKKAIKKRKKLKNLIAIGITGSFGKSSTKEFLTQILKHKFKTVSTKEHQNTEIGSARAILTMPLDTQVFVAEMGAYKRNDINEISQVVNPTHGIITGISEQHLSLQGNIENITETKFELAHILPKKAMLLINEQVLQIPLAKKKAEHYSKTLTIKTIGSSVINIKEALDGTEFVYNKTNFKTKVLGAHLIPNIILAIKTAQILGMSMAKIKQAVEKLEPATHTFTVKTIGSPTFDNKITIIDDTYSANSVGVLSALGFLERIGKGKNKILIMRSLVDLGEKGTEVHKKIGQKISQVCDLAIIIDNNFKQELQSSKTIFTSNFDEILAKIEKINKDSIVLLENRLPQELFNKLTKLKRY